MITFLKHIVQREHWKQNWKVELCIAVALLQSLLKLNTDGENCCCCLSWVRREGQKMLWECCKKFREHWFSNQDSLLDAGMWVSCASNGKCQATEINQTWSELWFDCLRTMSAMCYKNLSNMKMKSFCLEALFLNNLQFILSQIAMQLYLHTPSRHPPNFTVFEINNGF